MSGGGSEVGSAQSVRPERPAPARGFGALAAARKDVEERLLGLFGDDEVLVGEANALLDELDEVRREFGKLSRRQAEEKVRDRVEREVLGRFASGRPNVHVLKAEQEVRRLGLPVAAKSHQQREFDEAVWRLAVAHGYAMSRALATNEAVPAFRDQVVAALIGWAEAALNPTKAEAFRFAADRVARMVPLPGADSGADPGAGSEQ